MVEALWKIPKKQTLNSVEALARAIAINKDVISEAVVRSCSVKNMFLKISQNSQDLQLH